MYCSNKQMIENVLSWLHVGSYDVCVYFLPYIWCKRYTCAYSSCWKSLAPSQPANLCPPSVFGKFLCNVAACFLGRHYRPPWCCLVPFCELFPNTLKFKFVTKFTVEVFCCQILMVFILKLLFLFVKTFPRLKYVLNTCLSIYTITTINIRWVFSFIFIFLI